MDHNSAVWWAWETVFAHFAHYIQSHVSTISWISWEWCQNSATALQEGLNGRSTWSLTWGMTEQQKPPCKTTCTPGVPRKEGESLAEDEVKQTQVPKGQYDRRCWKLRTLQPHDRVMIHDGKHWNIESWVVPKVAFRRNKRHLPQVPEQEQPNVQDSVTDPETVQSNGITTENSKGDLGPGKIWDVSMEIEWKYVVSYTNFIWCVVKVSWIIGRPLWLTVV